MAERTGPALQSSASSKLILEAGAGGASSTGQAQSWARQSQNIRKKMKPYKSSQTRRMPDNAAGVSSSSQTRLGGSSDQD